MSYINTKYTIYTTAIAASLMMAACNGTSKDATLQAQQHTIDSMNAELAKKRVIDSMNEASRTTVIFPGNDVANTPQPVVAGSSATRSTTVARSTHRNYSGSTHHTSSGSSSNTVAQAPAPVRHKKGWSAKAKGAVIGAGTGAVVGAVVNKRNRAAGAVIGTVLGAGAGTGVGAIIDKKKGR